MSRLLKMSSDWFGCAKLFRICDTAPVLLKSVTDSTSSFSNILQLGVAGPVLLGAGNKVQEVGGRAASSVLQ